MLSEKNINIRKFLQGWDVGKRSRRNYCCWLRTGKGKVRKSSACCWYWKVWNLNFNKMFDKMFEIHLPWNVPRPLVGPLRGGAGPTFLFPLSLFTFLLFTGRLIPLKSKIHNLLIIQNNRQKRLINWRAYLLWTFPALLVLPLSPITDPMFLFAFPPLLFSPINVPLLSLKKNNVYCEGITGTKTSWEKFQEDKTWQWWKVLLLWVLVPLLELLLSPMTDPMFLLPLPLSPFTIPPLPYEKK